MTDADPLDDPASDPEALLERAREAPESVDVAAVERALTDADGDGDEGVRETLGKVLAVVAYETGDRTAVRALADLAGDDDLSASITGTTALAAIAEEYPEAVAVAMPVLRRLVEEDAVVAHHALAAIGHVATAESAAVAPAVPTLLSVLDDPVPQSRQRAAWALGEVARTHPDAVVPAVADLAEILEHVPEPLDAPAAGPDLPMGAHQSPEAERQEADEHAAARSLAAQALATLAEERPDAVADAAPAIRTALDADDLWVRQAAAELAAALAEERPDCLRPAVPRLLDLVVDGETVDTCNSAALALSAVAETDPDALADCREAVPDVFDLLDDDRPEVRGTAAGVLAYLAEVHPGAVAEGVDRIVSHLDDEVDGVRANAVVALRELDEPAARRALDRTARDDPSEQIRAIAAASVDDREEPTG